MTAPQIRVDHNGKLKKNGVIVLKEKKERKSLVRPLSGSRYKSRYKQTEDLEKL